MLGYKAKDVEAEDALRTATREHPVAYSKEPEWTMDTSEHADSECRILQSLNVHVEQHYCDFSVEEVRDGVCSRSCARHIRIHARRRAANPPQSRLS